MVYVFQTTIFWDTYGYFFMLSLQDHCFLYKSPNLVGGFNPSEQYESKWKSSPNRGENKEIFDKSPTSDGFGENKAITKGL